MSTVLVVGLFVGGKGTRLGGVAKGTLVAPDGRQLLPRLVATVAEALPDARIVLVGNAAAYRDAGLLALADSPAGIGPLGGLAALLSFTASAGHEAALALSCDLPYVGSKLVRRLATEFPGAAAVAPREEDRWSPLTARYSLSARAAVDAAIGAGTHSLQRVFSGVGPGARELPLHPRERAELRDWDTPGDLLA